MPRSFIYPSGDNSIIQLGRLRNRSSQRCREVAAQAKKGFGKQAVGKKGNIGKDEVIKKPKQKKKRLQQESNAPALPPPNSREERFQQTLEKEGWNTLEENAAFERRLVELQKKGESLQSLKEPGLDEGGILAAKPPQQRPPLDTSRQQIKSTSDKAEGGFGIPQLAIGIVSLGLVAAFIFTSGGGPGPSTSSSLAGDKLSEEQLRFLQDRSKELGEKLKENPEDVSALKELSDLSAALGDFKRSSSLAEKITQTDSKDSEAWLTLADAKERLGDHKAAAAAYGKSLETGGPARLPQLQGLASALVLDKKPAEAVQKLQRFVALAGQSDGVGAVELQLLIAKVYSQWDNHFSSALAVYDDLIEKHPDDFRGYLARGVLLKENGRKGDAQRMFIKAKFLAPSELEPVVDNLANR